MVLVDVAQALTSRQVVEVFHLVFVRALFSDVTDKRLLAIKGGINLRFFFQSVRYSEDLDLDVIAMSKATLEKRIDRLLGSPAVVTPLRARGLTIQDISKPKQTETVQRWKCSIATLEGSEDRTKIEFSRRAVKDIGTFESVDPEIANAYSIPSFLATHYGCADAVRQKIHALEGRSQTQPRDVFDLHLLFARTDAPTTLEAEARGWAEKAAENAAALTYDEYRSLVVAYLDPTHEATYASRAAWESLQSEVVERILALA